MLTVIIVHKCALAYLNARIFSLNNFEVKPLDQELGKGTFRALHGN